MAKLKTPKPVTIDFETDGILGRPEYPPKPVGVSIQYPGKKPHYFAWGHYTGGNNCTFEDAEKALQDALMFACAETDDMNIEYPGHGACFQNGKFDVDVLEVHFPKLKNYTLAWHEIHDTMFLLYLHNPHADTFSLKPSAEAILGMKPEEQDAVKDWLIANQPVPADVLAKYGAIKVTEKNFGAFIAWCPGNIVEPYANGDTDRTSKLFKKLWPSVCVQRDMLRAYDRERELMLILLAMERQGVPVDHKQLRKDVKMYSALRTKIEAYLRTTLKAPELNLNSGDQLIEALIATNKVDTALLGSTPTGKYATTKESLNAAVKDKALVALLNYHSQISTCLDTFMVPWLKVADKANGMIFTSWQQTKSTESGGFKGTKTGRLSSSPNFQNIPKEFNPTFKHHTTDKKIAKGLPKAPAEFADMPPLPLMRKYIVPFKGEVLIDRDYSQQEPRILAHFVGGQLLDAYINNPWIDFHDFAKAELANMGLYYERRPVKNTNLGLIYGMGVGKLAAKNNQSVEEAGVLKKAILRLYPGLTEINREMKRRAMAGEPIRTWGGREYYCEEAKMIAGRMMTFDYKMVNVLIQGSAADCTKEAIIRYWRNKPANHKLILQVHDQLVVSVPPKEVTRAMSILHANMESVEFNVPMLSEGEVCKKNWCDKIDYDKKGVSYK